MKAALRSIILHRAADFDQSQLPANPIDRMKAQQEEARRVIAAMPEGLQQILRAPTKEDSPARRVPFIYTF